MKREELEKVTLISPSSQRRETFLLEPGAAGLPSVKKTRHNEAFCWFESVFVGAKLRFEYKLPFNAPPDSRG